MMLLKIKQDFLVDAVIGGHVRTRSLFFTPRLDGELAEQ